MTILKLFQQGHTTLNAIPDNPEGQSIALLDVATFCYNHTKADEPLTGIMNDLVKLEVHLKEINFKTIYFLDSPRISRAKLQTNKARRNVYFELI